MIRTTLTISNRLGLHARASAKLTKLAGGFSSDIHLARNGRRVNAKSIMGVMMLAAGPGAEVELEADGAARSSTTGSAKATDARPSPRRRRRRGACGGRGRRSAPVAACAATLTP